MSVLPITHIASDPGHRGGKPRIARKGITVEFLAGYLNSDTTVEDICRLHDLTPGEVYAAWSYYYDHQEEIDESIRQAAEAIAALPSLREHLERKKTTPARSE
jgi:uncharacterized protein (DUF433 family)